MSEFNATYFRFSLILPANPSLEVMSGDITLNNRGRVRPTVLIVSNDNIFYSEYKDILSAWYDLFSVKNLNSLIKSEHIDAVLCDVTLLDSASSLSLCEEVKSSETLCNVPLVCVNKDSSSEVRTACLRGGADAYVDDFHCAEALYYQVDNLLSLRKASSSPAVKRSAFKEKIDRILEAQLSDMDFSVGSLAEAMNMSPTNFHRRFKAQMGMTPGDYILEFRMSRAAQFICEGMYIGDVSVMLGYTSSSYFSKCFKKVNGLSPKEYLSEMVS